MGVGEGAAYQGLVALDAHAALVSLGSQSLDTFSTCHHQPTPHQLRGVSCFVFLFAPPDWGRSVMRRRFFVALTTTRFVLLVKEFPPVDTPKVLLGHSVD